MRARLALLVLGAIFCYLVRMSANFFSMLEQRPWRFQELPGYPCNLRSMATQAIVAAGRWMYGNSPDSTYAKLPVQCTGEAASEKIAELLARPAPCMISRWGAGEADAVLCWLDIHAPGSRLKKAWNVARGRSVPFWWDNSRRSHLCWNAGCFPPTDEGMNAFGARAAEDSREIDLIGSCTPGEKRLASLFSPNAVTVGLLDFAPFFRKNPWTRALEGKTVLVVYPFATSIQNQYARRALLFPDNRLLPDFTLKTYKPVVSFAGEACPFATWIEALDHMCAEIRRIDFDIAIIGAGAYGMSLAADVKRSGRKAFHLAGVTQLLFGIMGGRWESYSYAKLFNEHWVRPLPEETPKKADTIEKSAYW